MPALAEPSLVVSETLLCRQSPVGASAGQPPFFSGFKQLSVTFVDSLGKLPEAFPLVSFAAG
jgi:hypothetical protein